MAIGLLANSVLEWTKEALQKRSAAGKLRRAIISELQIEHIAAADDVLKLKISPSVDGESTLVPIQERHTIFDAHQTELGNLKAHELSAVLSAYTLLRARPELFVVLGRVERLQGNALSAPIPAAANKGLLALRKGSSSAAVMRSLH